jgi:hypothetical protein
MDLRSYLTREGLSFAEFGRRCATPHARTIERIAKGQKKPGSKMLPKIIAASNGEVTANDFFPSPAVMQ